MSFYSSTLLGHRCSNFHSLLRKSRTLTFATPKLFINEPDSLLVINISSMFLGKQKRVNFESTCREIEKSAQRTKRDRNSVQLFRQFQTIRCNRDGDDQL